MESSSESHSTFIYRCVHETLWGLNDGLSRFSGPTRSAVIFSLHAGDPLQMYDPHSLLDGYEPRIKASFYGTHDWRKANFLSINRSHFHHLDTDDSLSFDGLIHYGCRSGPVFYQLWLTEHHPDLCSTGPTKRWLKHAALRFSHDIANDSELYTGISGRFLREYATHAVADYLTDQAQISLGANSAMAIHSVLEAVLAISKATEEGAKPYGEILFIEPKFIHNVPFITRFQSDQQPNLDHSKYVRKLLQSVEHSEKKLVSDGKNILGITDHHSQEFYFAANFHRRRGFLHQKNEIICSFEDGHYKSTNFRAKLFEIEEILLDLEIDPQTRTSIFQIARHLVHEAERMKFGCTIVIDLNGSQPIIAGQVLDPPIDLSQLEMLNLASGLSKVDGALYVCLDLKLHGFGCLLDGLTIPAEDRSRGARYNSALRFSAGRPKTIIVVVSSDHPVSIIFRGKEIRRVIPSLSQSPPNPHPVSLRDWLDNSES